MKRAALALLLMLPASVAAGEDAAITRKLAVAMTPRELADRAFAQMGGLVVDRVVQFPLPPGPEPFLQSVWFFGKPQPSEAGLCSEFTVRVDFRSETDSKSGSVDRPSRAYDMQTEGRFFVVRPVIRNDSWSDEYRQQMTDACTPIKPSLRFFRAEDRRAAWKGAYLLQKAIDGAKAGDALPIACSGDNNVLTASCTSSRDQLAGLQLTRLISVSDCSADLDYQWEPSCVIVRVLSGKDGPGIWVIKLTGADLPSAIVMRAEAMPPDSFPPD